jgi:hypothetical protein
MTQRKRPVDTPDAVETIPASVDSLDTVEKIYPLRGVPDGSFAKALPGGPGSIPNSAPCA